MKKAEFIAKIKEDLEVEDELTLDSRLDKFLDSLGTLALIALIDENFGKSIPAEEFQKFTTIQSLIDYIGEEHFE